MNKFDEIRTNCGGLFPHWHEQPGEVYADLTAAEVRPAASVVMESGSRAATVFAEDRRAQEGCFIVYYCFEHPADRRYLLLRTATSNGSFPSIAAEIPAVNWHEREIQDWFGLQAEGHPNPRRVALHDNWPDVHPMLKDFPLHTVLPPFAGDRHVYRPTLGEGVFQIPVGPIHAGIIEPGHFNFAVAGEPILYLQLRMFYVHKGIEKRFESLPVNHAVFLAERISGDSSLSHAVAFCQAIEKAGHVAIPPRAAQLRTILLELERIYNHVADIGAIATDVGFVIANAHASRLRESILALNEQLTGSRLLRGVACSGGLRRDCPIERLSALAPFAVEFDELMAIIESSDSTRDRLERTGTLRPEKARDLGIVGVGGRASGIDRDLRRDHPYAAYDSVALNVPVYQEGDVLRRMQVRVDEIRESLRIIRTLATAIQPGPVRAAVPELPPNLCALGAVEGWRGEILHWIRTGEHGRLERCKIKDPSLNNWPALVEAVEGNIVPDFPVINKSFNLSYSGTDR
jgi:Ni,Fe-hydrogenase III large subunit/Ni,Fe-hydrogenase III component G